MSYIADVVVEKIDPVDSSNIHICMNTIIPNKFDILYNICINELIQQGFNENNITCIYYLNCRYSGTDTALMIPFPNQNTMVRVCIHTLLILSYILSFICDVQYIPLNFPLFSPYYVYIDTSRRIRRS